MYLTCVLCKISVVEYSYGCFLLENITIDLFGSNYINLWEITCSYGARIFEKLKELV